MSSSRSAWNIEAAPAAMRCRNFIREIVDVIKIPAHPPQPVIPLSIGDPTIFGNLPPPPGLSEELLRVASGGQHNGYANAMGVPAARQAIADTISTAEHPVSMEDVAVTSGCSHALLMAFQVLCKEGTNVLVPSPGFSLYRTVCAYLGIECRFYRLDPANNWQIDIAHMESLADANTAAVLVNNPSNPCGSNFSLAHVDDVLAAAERMRLPIISDEVYAGMVFAGQTFHSFARRSQRVPVLLCGGTAKQFMIPGWRVGWVVSCDRQHLFERGCIVPALAKLSQTILGANSVAQGCVPFLLQRVPASYREMCNAELERNAMAFSLGVARIPGLHCIVPQGAMYSMVGIDLTRFTTFPSEVEFAQALLDEQQVFVLPGSCFTMPGFFRVVVCAPADKLTEATRRMAEFCDKHRKP